MVLWWWVEASSELICFFSYSNSIFAGAVGVEMAAELKMTSPDFDVTLIHSRDKLLSAEPLPDEFKDKTLDLVRECGVKVILGHRVLHTTRVERENGKTTTKLKLSDGTSMTAGHVISAISSSISTSSYLPPAALDSDGLVRINDTYEILIFFCRNLRLNSS
jgi:NADH dehydrogenase FAD-containing subunit